MRSIARGSVTHQGLGNRLPSAAEHLQLGALYADLHEVDFFRAIPFADLKDRSNVYGSLPVGVVPLDEGVGEFGTQGQNPIGFEIIEGSLSWECPEREAEVHVTRAVLHECRMETGNRRNVDSTPATLVEMLDDRDIDWVHYLDVDVETLLLILEDALDDYILEILSV
jgi:hypothetical protein